MGEVKHSGLTARVIKALGIFGSLEALKMLCSVVRTKLVAIWIGAVGVGVITLYSATTEMIRTIASLNLRQSSIPAIASADEVDKPHLCRSVELLGVIIGLAATILVAILSPLLSYATFGDYDHTWGFALLAPTFFAASVTDARQSIFQGLDRLRTLALASFYAVLAATVVALPLFYFFRMAAIVPVLIVFPFFTLIFTYITPGSRVKHPPHDHELFKATVKTLVKLGSSLTFGVAIGFAADYLLRIYITREGGVDEVGIFQAGNTIVKSYVGIIFTALTMEFFPRISATINDENKTSEIINHEVSLMLKILIPVVLVLIFFGDIAVKLLYSSDFLATVPYISVAIIATFLRLVSWCFSYIIIAKGNGKIYIATESISAVSLLVFSYFGWRWGSFEGLGWAYLGQFVMFTAATWGFCHFRYHIRIKRRVWLLTFGACALAFAVLWGSIYLPK